MPREDILAIKAYLFSLEPAQQPNRENDLGFPFNQRRGIALPAFNRHFNDAEVAALANFTLGHFGQRAGQLSAEIIGERRAEDTEGAPRGRRVAVRSDSSRACRPSVEKAASIRRMTVHAPSLVVSSRQSAGQPATSGLAHNLHP